MENQHGVADDARGVALRGSEGAVVQFQIGQRYARGELEIVNDEVALDRLRCPRGVAQQAEHCGDTQNETSAHGSVTVF